MNQSRIIRYFAAWDARNNQGVMDVEFGDPNAPERTRILADNAAELAALLAIMKASPVVWLGADDTGRMVLKSEWAAPGI